MVMVQAIEECDDTHNQEKDESYDDEQSLAQFTRLFIQDEQEHQDCQDDDVPGNRHGPQ